MAKKGNLHQSLANRMRPSEAVQPQDEIGKAKAVVEGFAQEGVALLDEAGCRPRGRKRLIENFVGLACCVNCSRVAIVASAKGPPTNGSHVPPRFLTRRCYRNLFLSVTMVAHFPF